MSVIILPLSQTSDQDSEKTDNEVASELSSFFLRGYSLVVIIVGQVLDGGGILKARITERQDLVGFMGEQVDVQDTERRRWTSAPGMKNDWVRIALAWNIGPK